MDGMKVLFHGVLVRLEGRNRDDASRCDKIGPNVYRIEGCLYFRDGKVRPENPGAPAIATIFSYAQAKRAGLIEVRGGYAVTGGKGYRPEYDFEECYSKKAS